MSREADECEKSLGKPPAVPPQEPNVMNVSDSVVKRINTGTSRVLPRFINIHINRK